jgi:hypothetical protein
MNPSADRGDPPHAGGHAAEPGEKIRIAGDLEGTVPAGDEQGINAPSEAGIAAVGDQAHPAGGDDLRVSGGGDDLDEVAVGPRGAALSPDLFQGGEDGARPGHVQEIGLRVGHDDDPPRQDPRPLL